MLGRSLTSASISKGFTFFCAILSSMFESQKWCSNGKCAFNKIECLGMGNRRRNCTKMHTHITDVCEIYPGCVRVIIGSTSWSHCIFYQHFRLGKSQRNSGPLTAWAALRSLCRGRVRGGKHRAKRWHLNSFWFRICVRPHCGQHNGTIMLNIDKWSPKHRFCSKRKY